MGITGYFVTLTVTVSTGDTFNVRDLARVAGAVGLKVADWSSLSFTYAGNTITVITVGLSSTPIVVLAGGQK